MDRLANIPGLTDAALVPPSPAANNANSSISITGDNNRVAYTSVNGNSNSVGPTNPDSPPTDLPPPPEGTPKPPPPNTDEGITDPPLPPNTNEGITDSQLLESLDNAENNPADLTNSPIPDSETIDANDANPNASPTHDPEQELSEFDHTSEPTTTDTVNTKSIYEAILPSGNKLNEAYSVPEDLYRFHPKATIAIPSQWENRLNEFQDFTSATEPLIPLEPLTNTLNQLKSTMANLTHNFEKQKKSIQRAATNNNHIHKCVNVRAVFHTPDNATKFPPLNRIFDNVSKDLKAASEAYAKIATRIITKGQEVILFQLRLERILTLTDSLINNLANFHAYHYRQLHKHKHTELNGYIPKTREELATMAVQRLLLLFDRDLLTYFDISPKALIDVFNEYHPETKTLFSTTLNDLDQEAMDHALEIMCRYIKHVTCIPHNQQVHKARKQAAADETLAAIERQQARHATQATHEAIMKHAASYPTTPRTLTEAVLDINKKQALLQRKQEAKRKLHEAKRNALKAKRKLQSADTDNDDNIQCPTPQNKKHKPTVRFAETPKDTSDTSPPVAQQRGKPHNKKNPQKGQHPNQQRGQQNGQRRSQTRRKRGLRNKTSNSK